MATKLFPDPDRASDTTYEGNDVDAEKEQIPQTATSDNAYSDTAEKTTPIDAEAQRDVAASPPKNPMDPSLFPDGGRQAWSTVVGAWCALFVSFGKSKAKLPAD
jgi:hypothetical protein